jgi:Asp-tRNA(Asn)/Glu-tRNA(Gln) amidotransferase A subunit family amidase
MARTVADLQILFEVMAGYDDGDPCSAPVKVSSQFSVLSSQRKVNRLPVASWPNEERRGSDQWVFDTHIGFFEDDGRTLVTKETRDAVRQAAYLLSTCGFHVDAFRPEGLEEARRLWWDFFGAAGGMILEPMLRGLESELSPILREFFAWTQQPPKSLGFASGSSVSGYRFSDTEDAPKSQAPSGADHALLASWLARDAVRERILLQTRKFPVLICPVAAIPAFRHGERESQVEGRTVKYLDAWSYCEWFNLLGFPACVVPMGSSPEGLPIGVQIVGRPWQDELVLAVAAKLEAERGPWPSPFAFVLSK